MRHMHTEEILTNQAKELINVADTASTDSHKLHESIARRKVYDQNNEEACKKLDITMSEHLSNMSSNLKTFTNDFEHQVKSVIEHMSKLYIFFFDFILDHFAHSRFFIVSGENTNKSKSMCQNAITNLRLLIECEQQGKADIENCISNQKTKFTDLFGKHTDENRDTLKNAMELKALFDQQLSALQTDLTEQFSSFERDYGCLWDLVRFNRIFDRQQVENGQIDHKNLSKYIFRNGCIYFYYRPSIAIAAVHI